MYISTCLFPMRLLGSQLGALQCTRAISAWTVEELFSPRDHPTTRSYTH